MGYCVIDDMRKLLPNNITIGDKNIGTPTPINQGARRDNITPLEAERYIAYAQQHIDSLLRPYYVCPLRRIKFYETNISNVLNAGTSVNITVDDSGYFSIYDLVRISDDTKSETAYVIAIIGLKTITLDTVTNNYLDGYILSTIKYPDPIPLIAARYAVSFVLDRMFVAEQSPDVSNYGKTQRNLAVSGMENILTGTTLLHGQDWTGRRFVRGSLLDAFKSPAEIQKGQEKEA